MYVVTVGEMRAIEQAANEAGHSYDTMMENAGLATAMAVEDQLDHYATVLVLVGPGNNGGDGLVAARYLQQRGHEAIVYIWKRDQRDDPNLARAQEARVTILWADQDAGWAHLSKQVRRCDAVVDALLGTGATGMLRGTLRELIAQVRETLAERDVAEAKPDTPLRDPLRPPTLVGDAHPCIVAVDVPSGLDGDTGEIDDLALYADLTVTFAYPKRGHYLFPGAAHVGRLLVADIGVDPHFAEGSLWQVATPETIAARLPARPLASHKGTYGKALIIAGSTHYAGAPRLAAEAAYRSGAGLVTLAVGETIYPIIAASVLEPTFLILPDDLGALIPAAAKVLAERLEGYDALLIGPGLGTEERTGEFLRELLLGQESGHRALGFRGQSQQSAKRLLLPPLVLDADGLNLLKHCSAWWEYLPVGSVVTPHPGEMARLLGCDVHHVNADRLGVASQAAAQWGCTVVLKGAYTVVAAPDGRGAIIPHANPALATAGTGDVLAGTIVGLVAQGLSGYEAAVCGAYLHGLAGALRRDEIGDAGLLAGDLLSLLPLAIRQTKSALQSKAR